MTDNQTARLLRDLGLLDTWTLDYPCFRTNRRPKSAVEPVTDPAQGLQALVEGRIHQPQPHGGEKHDG